jgi:hypothetical protein
VTDILSDDEIRALFIAAGFTVKDGHADLKPYVYAAARAVERAVVSRLAAMGGELPEPTYYGAADQLLTERAKGVAAGMAAERARCVAVCDELSDRAPGQANPSYVEGWCDAFGTAEQAISSGEPAPDEKEQTR